MRAARRFALGHLPTPLEKMRRLSSVLGGPELWIKRDDQTGLATGGNKTRKLELFIGDALAQGADVVLTVGAVQSNHCRQTAAAAARAGLDCMLVLRGGAPPRGEWTGNLLLDDLLGAQILWAEELDPLAALDQAAEAQRSASRTPYVIPYGGSNVLGATAYVLAFEEAWYQMHAQDLEFDRVVFATSSGGTQAGLIVGARARRYQGEILGISVDKTGGHLAETVSALIEPTARFLDLDIELGPDDVHINDDYVGGGYAVLTETEEQAIRFVARTEGILLDPVYTGKAMAGLLGMIRQGQISSRERVLFWHTGGMPALFAYASDIASR